jgi:hypothetical protein
LMREALARGLQIGPLAEGEIMRLDEPHAKHWPRYPRAEDKPILMIDNFEPYAAELFRGVSKAIRGG